MLLSLGEVEWDRAMGTGHLERLKRAVSLPAARGTDTSAVRPACYGGAGFTDEPKTAEKRGEAVLVDPERLHRGNFGGGSRHGRRGADDPARAAGRR
ncbi:hypothetical protein [Streptomyces sp. YIM B13518]|uniref:hypothetical protein n=1 Tax=Streptomyces sp. YIM B13518 TaxID=3366316 RepID=UPI0036CD13DB